MENSSYDSILKEKDVGVEEENKHKYFKLFIFFSILVSLVIVAVSYFIYYSTILDNESIFFNNITKVNDYYYKIYKDIIFSYNLEKNYVIEGDIDVGNDNYKYSFSKDSNKIKRVISKNNKSISYYEDGNNSYLKLSTLGDFYVKDTMKFNDLKYYKDNIDLMKNDLNNYLYSSILDKSSYDLFNQIYNMNNISNIIKNVETNYRNSITNDKYIRKVYLDDKIPTIEVNVVLNKDDINKILGNSNLEVQDDEQINITMKNNAITNKITSIKITINNKTNSTRRLFEYKKDILYYTDAEDNNYSLIYNSNKNNIQIKKNNVLYSVVQIASKNKTNIFTYKVIDKIYTVSLAVEKLENNFEYSIETNIDDVPKVVKISGNYKDGEVISDDLSKAVSIESLSIDQQNAYKKKMSEVLK